MNVDVDDFWIIEKNVMNVDVDDVESLWISG